MDIDTRLKFLREKNGISVYKLSKLSEVSSTYIHEIESGEKQPTVLILKKICDALNISLSAFFRPLDNSNEVTESPLTYEYDMLTPELIELIKSARNLSPEQIMKLNEFIKSIK